MELAFILKSYSVFYLTSKYNKNMYPRLNKIIFS